MTWKLYSITLIGNLLTPVEFYGWIEGATRKLKERKKLTVFIAVLLNLLQAAMAEERNNGMKNNYPPVLQLQGSKLSALRVTQLKHHFFIKYKQEPEFFVRVPGR
jgi:hypothetical protein